VEHRRGVHGDVAGEFAGKIGPRGGNQRARSVGKNQQQVQSARSSRATQQLQFLAFKRMPLTDNLDGIGKVLEMGSVL
jgi:hypothetical protein